MSARFTAGMALYADFAVFGPWGRKTHRANKYKTWVPIGDGTYLSKELPGPDCHAVWKASWRCFVTLMVKLTGCSRMLSALEAYADNIGHLVSLWPRVWHLIVEGDNHMRAEGLENINRRTHITISHGEPAPYGWDSEDPWTYCCRAAANNNNFWEMHVKAPAAAWVASGGKGTPRIVEETLRNFHTPGEVATVPPTYQRNTPANNNGQQKYPQPDPNSKTQRRKAQKAAQQAARATAPHTRPPKKGKWGGKAGGKGGDRPNYNLIGNQTHPDTKWQICHSWCHGFGRLWQCGEQHAMSRQP